MSLGSVLAPDTVEKKGLLRRPKNRKAIDIAAFEGGVEQNMQRKGFFCAVISVLGGRALYMVTSRSGYCSVICTLGFKGC